ncbi:MAG: hypothetical protein ACLTDX_08725 [[Clostridium] innocuum]
MVPVPCSLSMRDSRIGEVSALRIEDICLADRLIQIDESLNRVMTYERRRKQSAVRSSIRAQNPAE